jgi:hypothetical protein
MRLVTALPHFTAARSWEEAEAQLTFRPVVPAHTSGFTLKSLHIHVRDHKLRELPAEARTLEAHYGGFVLSQSKPGQEEARRQALDVSYGRAPLEARIAGHAARMYNLGPEPPPDDIDGRSPAVVTWHDAGMFYLIASSELCADDLLMIAVSMYGRRA